MIGNDHYHSMDYKDLKIIRSKIKNLHEIIGDKEKNYLKSEKIQESLLEGVLLENS